jgi:cytochrome c oxidase subunit 3/cytochrome o ubiquinol oxidase subunit 3
MANATETTDPAHATPQAPAHGSLSTSLKGKAGMAAFLVTEVAFFSTLIVTYITYIGRDQLPKMPGSPPGMGGPTPREVFYMPLVIISTICLFSSSATIHLATGAMHRGAAGAFKLWWGLTIFLGALFLVGTGIEWHDLIFNWKLTPARNLFGTTYFTLVGFHAFHVTMGLMLLLMVLGFALRRGQPERKPLDPELVSWYWHFVDGVWVAVFTVVYVVGR